MVFTMALSHILLILLQEKKNTLAIDVSKYEETILSAHCPNIVVKDNFLPEVQHCLPVLL